MRQLSLVIWVSLSLFCSLVNVRADTHTAAQQQYDVKKISFKEGLAQSSVRGLLQDRNGLIWLGSEAGLQSFDGLNLRKLETLLLEGYDKTVETFWVHQLLETPNGGILIATERNGLYLYDPQQHSVAQFSEQGFSTTNIDKTPVYQICIDLQQQLWAATGQGLLKVNWQQGGWEIMIPTPATEHFLDVACTSQGIIARQQNTLIKYLPNTQQVSRLTVKTSAADEEALQIIEGPEQRIYVGKDDGLFLINAKFTHLKPIWPLPLAEDPIQTAALHNQPAIIDMLPHSTDTLWLATRANGLVLIDLNTGKTLRQLQHSPGNEYSISGNEILRIMKDQSNLLWISIQGVGINHIPIDKMAMTTYYQHSDNAILDNDITAISQDSHKNLWFTTNRQGIKQENAVTKQNINYSQQAIATYQHYHPGEHPFISGIAVDEQNQLWFTTDKGIIRLDLATNNHHLYRQSPDNLTGPRVRGRNIFISRQKVLYVTDQGGILRYNPSDDLFDRLPLADTSSDENNQRFRAIRQHHNGDIYTLGDHNIYRLEPNNTLEPLVAAAQLQAVFNGRLIAFAVNKLGVFYIAGQGAMLTVDPRMAEGVVINKHSDTKLPNNYFYSVELDNNGNPWLATNNGLVHFNVASGEYHHFGLSDGVLVQEFNGLASLKLDNGHILFGGIDGFTEVAPEKLSFNKQAPGLILTSYQTGSTQPALFLPADGIHMSAEDHWLQLSFSAMDYRAPQENQYAYYLAGFDPDWRNYGNKPTISFTGLPAGDYILHARATTKWGAWPEQDLQIPIRILPPFYRSGLAYALYVAALSLLVFGFIRWRLKLNNERAHYVNLVETSEERMKVALWGSNNSIWDWHIRDNKIFRTSIYFLGYEDDKIANDIDSFKGLIHPDDLALFEHEVEEVINDHTAEYSTRYRLKNKSGDWCWVADQGKVVERAANHKPTRLSGILKDISELIKHENELEMLNLELEDKIKIRTNEFAEQNAQLSETLSSLKNAQKQLVESEKMASLGNLVTGISHEVNTPVGIALTAATHNTETIKQLQEMFYSRNLTVNVMKKGLQQLMESNELIESSVLRTAHLIQTFKQLAVDHSHHEWRIIELPIYIIEIIPTFNPLIAGTNHKITVVDNDFFDVECAPGDLYQIISQLINNTLAHGFCQTIHGEIVIETIKRTDHWVLRYSDNGHGLEPESLHHIFDPFFTTKRCDGYAGLGLHLIYNIVTQSLGGTIECISEKEQGVTFLLKLPLSKPSNLITTRTSQPIQKKNLANEG